MSGTDNGRAHPPFGAIDDAALTRIVEELPLVSRPYDALATVLGMSEADVLAALKELRATHAVRRVSASFDAARLGYHATLGALAVSEDGVEAAAAAMGALPYVTHIFEVEDRYRLWFVVVVPASPRLEAAESEIVARTACCDVFRVLRAELVKITGSFDADGAPDPWGPGVEPATGAVLTPDEQALVRVLQGSLPLSSRPFAEITATLVQCGYDVDERWVLGRVEAYAAEGVLRRFGATLRKRTEPFRLALAVWPAVAVPDEQAAIIASFPEVLHCYERRVPGGGASVVSVIEIPDRPSLDLSIERIRQACGLDDPRVLYPVREFKRAPMKYLTDGEC